MKVELAKDQWGYFISRDFLKRPIFTDTEVPNLRVVVLKQKEYISDIDRMVVNTYYFLSEDGRLRSFDKREISKILAELMVDYMKEEGKYPYDTKVKKETKNTLTLSFQPDQYDEFNVPLKKEDFEGRHPREFLNTLKPAGMKPELEVKREPVKKSVEQSFSVNGSKDTYTVRKFSDGSWDCSCPHFMYRLSSSGGECKHIVKAKR